jgi:hypothetical protein
MGILLLLSFVIGTGLWLWMAWANKRGRSWARITATVFFGLLTAGGLALLIVVLTGVFFPAAGLGWVAFAGYWLPGLGAVILLWQRSSSDYYTAAGNRSKAVRRASRKPHDQPAARQVTESYPD